LAGQTLGLRVAAIGTTKSKLGLQGAGMNKQDIITAPVAVGALAWTQLHKHLEWIAAEAQLILPILGALWLVIQIVSKVYNMWANTERKGK
jgi:hypothetical protein